MLGDKSAKRWMYKTCALQNIAESNERRPEYVERFTMFMDWKSQCC